MAKQYTYKDFANHSILLAEGIIPENFNKDQYIEKANALLERETKKSDYSKANKKPSVSNVSDTTKENAEAILSVLSIEPMTTAEINEALGTNFEPLTVSNAIRYLEKSMTIVRTKKVETVIKVKNGVECKDQSPKTAYSLAK